MATLNQQIASFNQQKDVFQDAFHRVWMGTSTRLTGWLGAKFFPNQEASGENQEYTRWMASIADNARYHEMIEEHKKREAWNDLYEWRTQKAQLIHPVIRFITDAIYNREQKAIEKHQKDKGLRLIKTISNEQETTPVSSMVTLGRDGVMRHANGDVLTSQQRDDLMKAGNFQYSIPITSQHTGFTIHGQTYVMGANGKLLNQQGVLYGEDEITANIARLAAEQNLFAANRERGNVDCPASLNSMLKGIKNSTNTGLANILTGEQGTPIEKFLQEARLQGKVNPSNADQVKEFLRQQGMGRLIAHLKMENGAPIVKINGKDIEKFVWESSEEKALLDQNQVNKISKAVAAHGGDPNRLYVGGQFSKDVAEQILKGIAIKKAGIDKNTTEQGVKDWIRQQSINALTPQQRQIYATAYVTAGGNHQYYTIGYESAHPGFDVEGRMANFFRLCFKQDANGTYVANEQFTKMLPQEVQTRLYAMLQNQSEVEVIMAAASDLTNASDTGRLVLYRGMDSVLDKTSPDFFKTGAVSAKVTSILNEYQKAKLAQPPHPTDLGAMVDALNPDGSIKSNMLPKGSQTEKFLKALTDEDRYALRLAADEDRGRTLSILDSSARIQESPEWQNMIAKEVILNAGIAAQTLTPSQRDNYETVLQELQTKPFDRNDPRHEQALKTALNVLTNAGNNNLQIQSPKWLSSAIATAPQGSLDELKSILQSSNDNTGEYCKALTALVAPHFAKVLSDPAECKRQMESASKALQSGNAHTESSIFVPLMTQSTPGNWILNEDLVARALDTNRLLAHQAEKMYVSSPRGGLMAAYAPEHRNTPGLQAESTWMAKYLGHTKLIRVENGPADQGAIVVDPEAKVAFNMGLDHPPADRLIKDNGDPRNLTDFLAGLPEHSTIVDGNYIQNARGLCFNKKVCYTELEDKLERHAGLAERLGITLHHRVNGIACNSLNHRRGEAQRLQRYMRNTFEQNHAGQSRPSGPSGP